MGIRDNLTLIMLKKLNKKIEKTKIYTEKEKKEVNDKLDKTLIMFKNHLGMEICDENDRTYTDDEIRIMDISEKKAIVRDAIIFLKGKV